MVERYACYRKHAKTRSYLKIIIIISVAHATALNEKTI